MRSFFQWLIPDRALHLGEPVDKNDFYEDDEPFEDLLAAWEAGEKGFTSSRCKRCGHIVGPDQVHQPLGDFDSDSLKMTNCCTVAARA